MIRKAAEFAARAHEGVMRKGSQIPYISHPMEVAMIVSLMTDDEDLIAAAYLHDVIEDAGVTYETLKQEFGTRVARLVRTESEDKSKTWLERKQDTIDRLETAGREDRLLAFGDKLSNLRSTAKDYLVVKDEIWKKFRAKDKRLHAWYYESMVRFFVDFEEYPFYQEYLLLLALVFGGADYGSAGLRASQKMPAARGSDYENVAAGPVSVSVLRSSKNYAKIAP